MVNLKYCPFCGSTNVKILLEYDEYGRRYWYAECQKCNSKGASYIECISGNQNKDEALEQIETAVNSAADAWNRRVDDVTDQT